MAARRKRRRNPNLRTVARQCALRMLAAGALKRGTWSASDRLNWQRAFNALQRLAGKRMLIRRGKLTSRAA